MGYTTDFNGYFRITPSLKPEHHEYLRRFNRTRHMKRDTLTILALEDPVRDAVGLEAGEEGQYYVGAEEYRGLGKSTTILDNNKPPAAQPGLWCQWVPRGVTPRGESTILEWDGGEKFYNYIKWLQYLIEHFFIRWGYSLTGDVYWIGEDSDDRGQIQLQDNTMTILEARIEYVETDRWLPEGTFAPTGEV